MRTGYTRRGVLVGTSIALGGCVGGGGAEEGGDAVASEGDTEPEPDPAGQEAPDLLSIATGEIYRTEPDAPGERYHGIHFEPDGALEVANNAALEFEAIP